MSVPPSQATLPDPTRGLAPVRFVRGAGYLFGALPWLLRRPALRRLVILPLGINLVLLVGLLVTALYFAGDLAGWLWTQPEGWLVALWYVAAVFVGLALLAVSYAVFLVLASLLGASFYEALSERTEALELGQPPDSGPITLRGLARDIGNGLGGAARSLARILFVALPLFALNLVPFVGPLAYAAINAALAGYTGALEAITPPAERRGYSYDERKRTVRDNLALCMGLGTAAALLVLVPVLNLAVVPLTVIGGTRLFLHLEAHGRTARDQV